MNTVYYLINDCIIRRHVLYKTLLESIISSSGGMSATFNAENTQITYQKYVVFSEMTDSPAPVDDIKKN